MKNKTLQNGFSIPELGFGCWPLWGYRTRNLENDDAKDISAIRFAYEEWIRAFDTAEMYAGGYSEELLGQAIGDYQREELFISSKVRWDNCSYTAIKHACNNSLKRTNLEYFDLYYIHWRETEFSLEESMKAMNELVDEGKIKYIGVSNFSVESLKEAQKYSKYPIVANQVHYNLIFREPEKKWLLEYCQNNDVILVAWRPIELGKLAHSGSIKLLEMAQKYKKTHAQVAINWLLSQKNVSTLFMSRNPEHISENMWALWWEMSQWDIEIMRKDFGWQVELSDAVILE